MENYIICPNCNNQISNDPLIDAAARKEGSGARAIICGCGERITYWAISALLRNQKTRGQRFNNWVQHIFKSRG